jgi:acyl homoserine lactone synthase
MITTIARSGKNLAEFRRALGEYRYRIFVEQPGWELPTRERIEHDQFDADDTVYVIGIDEAGEIHGCARLLPTSNPYLLSELFPHLMAPATPPCNERIWELSRFSVSRAGDCSRASPDVEANTRIMLAAAVTCAEQHAVERLITVLPLGMERLLSRIGAHAHRAGTPQRCDGKPIFASWIEIDDHTHAALAPDRSPRQFQMA